MSYDLTLKSDDHFSRRVKRRELETYLVGLGVLTPSGPDHFVLGDRSTGFYAEVDIELVSEEGDALEPGGSLERNCIRVHVPAAFSDPLDPQVFDVCRRIGGQLHWRVYDEQQGTYLE